MTHVTKETAALLKEKGFDLPCIKYYKDGGVWNATLSAEDYNRYENCISAPTLHEAADWLRSKGVHVYVQIINEGEGICYYHPNIQDVVTGEYFESEIFDGEYTHDLALESGIIHALKNYVK